MTTTIKTTFPYEDTSIARHQCTECGKWERSDKGDRAQQVVREQGAGRDRDQRCAGQPR